MSKSLQVLNAAKDFIVKDATARGVNLEDEFGTPDKFKEFVFAMTFKALKDGGLSTQEAFDVVAGEGAFEDMANKVWENAQK